MSEIEIISRKEAVSQGLKRYFTGKECPKGHIARRNVCDRGCVQCTADRRAKLDRTEYNLENKDKLREIAYAWRRRNPEKAKEASRRCSQNRRNNHGDLVRAAQREYYKNNSASEKLSELNRRARKKGSDGRFTLDDIQWLLEKQKYKCLNCGVSVKEKRHIDHTMPLFLGGANDKKNLQILCPTCNLRKNKKHPIDWAQENGRLL